MAVWKIITIICAVSVYAESKWNDSKDHETAASICDTTPHNSNKVQCYCGRLTNHPYYINTAECYQVIQINGEDPTWNRFTILQNVSTLTLTNTKGVAMSYIPTNALTYTKALLKLEVKYCNVERIHPYAFANLSLVEKIILRDNQIQDLAENAFINHSRLRTISLDSNNIAEVVRNSFVNLPSLEQLFLTANKITTLHDQAFQQLTNLKELEIDKNSIFSLNSDTFSGLRNLQKLELSGNNLEVIGDDTFAPLMNLRFLNLAENKIQMLDERAFSGLTQLQILSLEHNKLVTLENEKVFATLESLTSLSVKDNDLTMIKPEVILPILSNFYGKTSQLNLDGNKLECNCRLDVFRPLLNRTQNVRLSIDIQNLQCHPNNETKVKWDKIQESAKNNGQIFEDVESQQGENVNYEYYDETELNGNIFYFDMRFVLNCSEDENSNVNVPETTNIKPVASSDIEKYTKVTSSPPPIVTTLGNMVKSTERDTIYRGSLDLSTADTTSTETPKNNEIISSKDYSNKKPIVYDNRHEMRNTKRDNAYTTVRLATVSAKPVENKQYENEMASDEAKPDQMKSKQIILTENNDKSDKNNDAPQDNACLPFLAAVIVALNIFL